MTKNQFILKNVAARAWEFMYEKHYQDQAKKNGHDNPMEYLYKLCSNMADEMEKSGVVFDKKPKTKSED